MNDRGLVIVGCGGHARSVADVAAAVGYAPLLFVDPVARQGERIAGDRVVFPEELPPVLRRGRAFIVGHGDNARRQAQFDAWRAAGAVPSCVLACDARLGRESTVGAGTFVGFGAHVGPHARIGEDSIVNTRAVVEHEVVVGAHSHVSVNAVLAGRVRIGERVFVGAGAVVVDGVEVADDVVIGAGAVVVRSIGVPGTYVGVPARLVGRNGGKS